MMSRIERQSVVWLSLLIALRMLGLFMVLPVITVLGADLRHATAFSLGLVVGAYGLSQALCQIPLGALSDRVGRRPVVMGGLAVFALGALVAAMSDNVWVVVFGRFLQGAGAISSTVMAWIADNTRDHLRTKAMAMVGMCIGLSFALSLVLGPLLTQWLGLSGLFVAIAVLSIAAMFIAWFSVPVQTCSSRRSDVAQSFLAGLAMVLRCPRLSYLAFSVMVLHVTMTSFFVSMPDIMVAVWALPVPRHWMVYLPVLAGSFVLMIPLLIVVERRRLFDQGFVLAIGALLIGFLVMLLSGTRMSFAIVAMLIYFWGFNFLEALMPSLVSRLSGPTNKGTALGVFATAQFLGAFLGGSMAGWVRGELGSLYVFAVCAILVAIWWVISVFGASFRLFEVKQSA